MQLQTRPKIIQELHKKSQATKKLTEKLVLYVVRDWYCRLQVLPSTNVRGDK